MSLAAQITSTGIFAPSYEDILTAITASFQGIYGSDAYIAPDSQDGQLLAVFASAINDANQMAVSVYNSYSPATAQGAGLSSGVKLNGLMRLASSNSEATLTIVGQSGTNIDNGIVQDSLGNNWALPTLVNIPGSGTVSALATCQTSGAITAPANTITQIQTPTLGWQSATNPSGSSTGAPVESDATLRVRQSNSTALPSNSTVAGIYSAIGNVPGVERFWIYENPNNSVDANGAPAFSTYAVVEGGDPVAIATAFAIKKTPGSPTYGTTTETIVDQNGIPSTIHFFVATEVPITVQTTLVRLAGWAASTQQLVINSIIAYLTSNPITTEEVYLSRMFNAAALNGDPLSSTYNVSIMLISRSGPPAAANVALAFNEVSTATATNITVALV